MTKKMNKKAYNLGNQFSPLVDTGFWETDNGWIGYATIGGNYYESDTYKDKSCAESEILGYIEGLQVEIDKEIENLKKLK